MIAVLPPSDVAVAAHSINSESIRMIWFLFAMLSALFSAGAAVAQKRILFSMTALEFSFAVSIVIGVASMTAVFWVDLSVIPVSTLAVIVVKSVISGSAFLLVMIALKSNPISSALPLLGLTPAVTAFLALPVLGEAVHGWEMLGILMMGVGTYILEFKPGHRFQDILRSAWTERSHYPIFGALVLFGISSVLDRRLVFGLQVPPAVVLLYQHALYCLMFGSILAWRRINVVSVMIKPRGTWGLILLVACLTLAYRYLQLEATALAPVALVLAVKRSSIVVATLFGGRLFKEERVKTKLVGATIIVASGFLILRSVG